MTNHASFLSANQVLKITIAIITVFIPNLISNSHWVTTDGSLIELSHILTVFSRDSHNCVIYLMFVFVLVIPFVGSLIPKPYFLVTETKLNCFS